MLNSFVMFAGTTADDRPQICLQRLDQFGRCASLNAL
jgi:hypothetical protein